MLSAKFDHRRSAAVLLDQEMGMADAAGKTAADYAAGGDCLVLLGQESRCRDLFEAAQKGCEGCCRRLIGQTGQTRDIHSDSGGAKNRTALMVAAERGRTECVRVLMEREAGMRDGGGMSALMVAAGRGHEGCVELLVGKEAGMKDNEGHNARWHAVGRCNEMLAKVEECACGDLLEAVRYGCERHCMEFIGEAGKTRDVTIDGEKNTMTALMVAARYDRVSCVKALLEKEKGMKDGKGRSARWYARGECRQMVGNAEPCTCRNLFEAIQQDCAEHCRRFILQAGKKDGSGETALMKAARDGKLEYVRILGPKEKGLQN